MDEVKEDMQSPAREIAEDRVRWKHVIGCGHPGGETAQRE